MLLFLQVSASNPSTHSMQSQACASLLKERASLLLVQVVIRVCESEVEFTMSCISLEISGVSEAQCY